MTLRRLPFVLAVLVVPVACAQIAGLEDANPASGGAGVGSAPGPSDGSTTSANGTFAVTPNDLALSSTCNGSAPTETLSVTNLTNGNLPYKLEVPDGSGFALRDTDGTSKLTLSGTIGRTLPVHFNVDAKKAGSQAGVVAVTVGTSTIPVPVKVTVSGGLLELSPTLINFGQVRKETTSTQTVDIENTGTDAVNVTGFDGTSADFAVAVGSGGSANIPPGGSVQATVTLASGVEGSPITATVTPKTQAPTCGDLPTLTLQGQRVNEDVTVNPGSLAFGDVSCGFTAGSTPGATRTVVISNFGPQDATFTATLDPASWYTVSPASGTAPGKGTANQPGTATLTLTLKSVPPSVGDHDEKLSVAVSGATSSTSVIDVTAKSVGAMLDIQPQTLDHYHPQDTKSFTVKNTGNAFVFLHHDSTNGAFVLNTHDNPLPAGFFTKVDVTYSGSGSDTITAFVNTTRTDAPPWFLGVTSAQLCTPAPQVTLKTDH